MDSKKRFVVIGGTLLIVLFLYKFSGSKPSTLDSRTRMTTRITMLEERVRMWEKKTIRLDQAVLNPDVKIIPAQE